MRTAPLILSCLVAAAAFAQTSDEDYRVYNEHPRLLLTAQHLRLLKRERDRDSMRWRQFSLLVRAASEMPEEGFALGLFYMVTGDQAMGKRAVDWALGPGTDLRQLALVYDWCQPILGAARSKALAGKIRRLMDQRPADTLASRRDRVLAAVALAEDNQSTEVPILRETIEKWWREKTARALADGSFRPPSPDLYPLLEMMHVIRDNLRIEMREDAPEYFRDLPKFQILGNYPPPLAQPENEYRVPVYTGAGLPNVDRATIARAAGLAMVAYDNNQLENQFLQGWLIQDRFMLQGTLGAPYEYFWANPYQPGLSYFNLPVLYHDPVSGTLFVRSNWEDEALWFGLYQGEAQLFEDGEIKVLNKTPSKDAKSISVGDMTIHMTGTSTAPLRFAMEPGSALVIGLKPHTKYLVEIDDEEMREAETDRIGTLLLSEPGERTPGVRIEEESSSQPVAGPGH